MATFTADGDISGILAIGDDDLVLPNTDWPGLFEAFIRIAASDVVNNVFPYAPYDETATTIHAEIGGVSYDAVGTGFLGASGTVTHFETDDGVSTYSFDGSLKWSATGGGVTSGTITNFTAIEPGRRIDVTGSLKLVAPGVITGKITQIGYVDDDFTFIINGSLALDAMGALSGTITQISWFDQTTGGQVAVSGSFSVAGLFAAEDALNGLQEIIEQFFLAGADTLNFLSAAPVLDAGEGNDVLNGSVLGDNLSGGGGNDILRGDDGDDSLLGGSGNDSLDGGAGDDAMAGGAGDDVYFVDSPLDTVFENPGEGVDTVRTSVDFSLPPDADNLVYTGAGDFIGSGNGDANTIIGGIGNDTLDGQPGADKLDGGAGGNDIFVVDDAGDVIVDRAGIDEVQSFISWVLQRGLENLTLMNAGNINGTGNTGVNILTGNDDDNILDGGRGADTMDGRDGNDRYVVDNALDVLIDSDGEDSVFSSVTWVLGDDFEHLELLGTRGNHGTGNAGNNQITGNRGANTLMGLDGDDELAGNDGNDFLDGGAGADVLRGGNGNDTYTVDDLGDDIAEDPGAGTDTVRASVDWTLGDNFENLVLLNDLLTGTGNALNNTLIGTGGADILDGAGGADKMIGGMDDDLYIVDDAKDAVTELAGEGRDTIQSTVSFILPKEVEVLTLLPGAGNASATGNALDNLLIGNDGDNTLDGKGGVDTMSAGLGNDTYVIDNPLDSIIFDIGGVDTLLSSVTYSISGSPSLENLTLTGSAAINATGNTSNNVLTGNSGINTLDGGDGHDTLFGMAGNDILTGGDGNDTLNGGAGIDAMDGGAGFNTYIVDNAKDVVQGNGAYDWVESSVSYVMANGVDELTLTGTGRTNGTGQDGNNDALRGNGANNVLSGLGGNDVLIGNGGNDTLLGGDGVDLLEGGAGVDKMTGGAGTDGFNFEFATAFTGVDIITDFTHGDDTIGIYNLLSNAGWIFGLDDVNDFVQIRESGADSILSFDADGAANGANFVDFVRLQGATGLGTVDDLVLDGTLATVP